MSERLNNLLQLASYLPRTLRLVWAASRSWTLAWSVLLLVQGILPTASVLLTGLLVDALIAAINQQAAWEAVQPVLFYAGLLGGSILLGTLLQSLSEWLRTVQAELIQDHVRALIHKQSTRVDLAFYESPEYFDHLYRARDDAGSRPLSLLESGGGLLQESITLVSMAAVLLPYGFWIPLLLFASTLPALLVVLRSNRRFHQWWEATTVDRRMSEYYDTMLMIPDVAPEVRLFGLDLPFSTAYQHIRRRLRNEQLRLIRSQSLSQLGAGAVVLLFSAPAALWMVWRTLQGQISLGDLVRFYQAFNQGQGLMRSLLGNLGQIYGNTLFLGNLFEFLDLEPEVVDPSEPAPAPSTLQQGIRLRDVTFRYPGSEEAALEHFNLDIPAGKVVAIVGANGAGKSTLVKLLCRFYDPEAGVVEFDGIDARHLAIEAVRRMITVLFQFPVNYHVSAAENITMGDPTIAAQPEQVEIAARAAGAHEVIMKLPEGYNTMLGKWFIDGAELSGGEWQRVALARAFWRRAPLVVLDEPTSFMDSWAEADWLDRFRNLVAGRTALIITHRFTTAMRADIIHVMDTGKIVETGTHHELLATNGLYAQSWHMQMQASVSETQESLLIHDTTLNARGMV